LKICEILLNEAGGSKSYKAHKYSLDATERPTIDYGNTDVVWKKMAESIPHTKHINLESICNNIVKHPKQILTYFLDGSRHVFKVDDQAYHNGSRSLIYPIIAGQAGVGCSKRTNKRLSTEVFKQEFVIAIPDIANADRKSGFFEAITQNLNEAKELKRLNIRISAVLPYKTSEGGEFADRGTACIQDRMMKMEKDLVAALVKEGKIGQDNYLVKDGSLEYTPTPEIKKDKKKYQTFKNNYKWVLGLSKNFNPEACIDNTKKPNPGFIADLPLYHRTPVACYETSFLGDIQFAVWYLRIRDQNRTRTPFDGILKVEKILTNYDEVIDSDEVDLLSAHLINERMPTCYGSDFRWANHIYPIYLTESFVKSKYLSTEGFLNLF